MDDATDESPVALTVTYRPTDVLIPYVGNAKVHEPAQISQLAASIKEFGFNNPILLDGKNGVIAGHGRLEAAQKLGMAEVPTIDLSHLTDAQRRAYILADNRLGEVNTSWDFDLLSSELDALKLDGFDIDLTGFDDGFILGAEPEDGLTNEDEVPSAPEVAATVEGDVWLMDGHRLMCGDSTSVDAVDRLSAGATLDVCFTSPPYAQQREYKSAISDWDDLMNGVFAALPMKEGAQILVNLGIVHEKGRVNAYWDKWLDYMDSNEWPLFGWYVWDKGFGLPGNWNGRLAPAHEFIFHFSKGGGAANKWIEKKPENIKAKSGTGVRRKDGSMSGVSSPQSGLQPTKVSDSVIRVTPQMGSSVKGNHPAMFPVALCEHIYRSFAKAGDVAFEPFSGSGTSIIACHNMGMHCYAMELAPEYTDIAVTRWQNFTGKQATLEGDGRTFDEIRAERVPAEALQAHG